VTVGSSGGQEIDDVFDCLVGPMTSGLEAAIGSVLRIGSMVEAAVGEGAAQPLMEEQKQQRHLSALQAEAVGVTSRPWPLSLRRS
jgi:hypothetical protein